MLADAGIAVAVEPARIDEDQAKQALRGDGAGAERIAEALAELKALEVSRRRPGALVIGADQTLECEGRQFDKPGDAAAAIVQLLALAGREHRLVSAVAVALDGARLWHARDVARLTMRPFERAFAVRYVAACGGGATSSVGGYQLESLGAQLFTRVDGDFFTVLGLPLLPLLGFLRERGALPLG